MKTECIAILHSIVTTQHLDTDTHTVFQVYHTSLLMCDTKLLFLRAIKCVDIWGNRW